MSFKYEVEVPVANVLKARRWLIENSVDCSMVNGVFEYRNWKMVHSTREGFATFKFLTDDRIMMFSLKFT